MVSRIEESKLQAWAVSHIGYRRKRNEDSFISLPVIGLFAVADGMGGGDYGDVASKTAMESLSHIGRTHAAMIPLVFKEGNDVGKELMVRSLQETLSALNKDVRLKACTLKTDNMGSTCSILWLVGDYSFVAHTGDSSIFRYRDGLLVKLTEDMVLRGGFLGAALGIRDTVKGMVAPHHRKPADLYILCSDGVTTHLEGQDIANIIATTTPENIAKSLLDSALERGGIDNITIVVVRDNR